jgi:hypothetical protein
MPLPPNEIDEWVLQYQTTAKLPRERIPCSTPECGTLTTMFGGNLHRRVAKFKGIRNLLTKFKCQDCRREEKKRGALPPPALPPPDLGPVPAPEQPQQPERACSERARIFINTINNAGRGAQAINLKNEDAWWRGAHTVAAGPGNPAGAQIALSDVAKQTLQGIFKDFVASLREEPVAGQSSFDRIFFDSLSLCLRRANQSHDLTLFSFGRAQKFLTILLKYCYAWRLSGNIVSPVGDISCVDRWGDYFHIPIDSYTLKHIQQFAEYEHLVLVGGSLLSWKWQLTEPRYCRIQDAIRSLASRSGLNPLCYEMTYIWVTGPDPQEMNV